MPNPFSSLGEKLPKLAEKITGPPAIHQAAKEGDLARVRLLAQKNYNLDEVDQKHHRTALHIAAERSHDLIVGELLDRHAASALQDAQGRTPLLIAAENGNVKVVQLLLGPRNADKDRAAALAVRDERGYTPLLAAAAAGHAPMLDVLISAGASLADTLENRVSAGHLAARRGHVAALQLLVARGLNIRADTLDRSTLLHEAAINGQDLVIRWLLQQGLDPNIRTLSTSATPLELAIQGGCYQAVLVLRDATIAPIAGPLAPPGQPSAPPLPSGAAAPAPSGAAAAGGGAPVVHYPSLATFGFGTQGT